MSTDIITTSVNLPAHLRSRIGVPSALSDSMTAGIGGSAYKRISKKGSRFRIKDGNTETVMPSLTMRAVIVGASPSLTKTFYKGGYNPDGTENKAPDCYSNDGVRPASDATDPQAQLCATCPQNAWGSKVIDGKELKACTDQKRLAIISADADPEDPEIYLYTVTPSELTGFAQYGKALAAKGLAPEIVVTEISFDTQVSHPKCLFKFAGFIDEELLPAVDKLVGSAQVREITGEVTAVARDLGPAPKRKPGVQEVEEVEVEVVVEEPKKAKGKGFAAPPPAPPKPQREEPTAAKTVQSTSLALDIQGILDSLNAPKDENDE